MTADELKNSVIFQVLKKDKETQQAVSRLGRTEDWVTLRQFVAKLKQTLLEATLDADDLEEIKKYKHLIFATENIVLLPQLVDLVKEIEKKGKVDKEEEERDAQRRKFNPGSYVRQIIEKIKRR